MKKDINELARAGRLGRDPSVGAVELVGGGESMRPDPHVDAQLDADRRWNRGARG